jgi:hypothetical protein
MINFIASLFVLVAGLYKELSNFDYSPMFYWLLFKILFIFRKNYTHE